MHDTLQGLWDFSSSSRHVGFFGFLFMSICKFMHRNIPVYIYEVITHPSGYFNYFSKSDVILVGVSPQFSCSATWISNSTVILSHFSSSLPLSFFFKKRKASAYFKDIHHCQAIWCSGLICWQIISQVICVCEGSIFEYHYIVNVTMKTVIWAYLNLRKGQTAPEMKECFLFFNWKCVLLSFANAGGTGHHSCQKPFYPSFWALPILDGLKKVRRRSRLLKTEVEEILLWNVLLVFCALTFCRCLWTSFSLLMCLSTLWVTQWALSSFPPLKSLSSTSFSLSSLIFVNVPGQICSANLSWVSPAWSQLSVCTVLSFSVTLPMMASHSPLHLPLSFEYKSEMDFKKSKSLPAERAVDLFFLYGEIWKIPLAISFSLQRCLTQLRRGGRFSLMNFLLHLICLPPAYHKSNSLSLKSVSLPHWGTSTCLPFLPFSTLLLAHLEMSYSQCEDSSYLSCLLPILTTPITTSNHVTSALGITLLTHDFFN